MKKIALSIALWMISAAFVFLCSLNNLAGKCFIGDDFILQPAGTNDMELQGEQFAVTGGDAFFMFDLEKEELLYNGKLYLGQRSGQDVSLQIYFAGSDMGFMGEYDNIHQGERL